MEKTLLIFGYGYTARVLARALLAQGWTIYGTTRNSNEINTLRDSGIHPILWETAGTGNFDAAFSNASHIHVSTAPDNDGDPVLREFSTQIAQMSGLKWLGYLSTIGVYGDRQGGWVDENSALLPATKRGKLRVAAEKSWQSFATLPLHIFRLAGIYGPGRGPFAKVKSGTARRIIKKDQVFSRTHVDDITQVLMASIAQPDIGAIYNVCDDLAAPPQDVISHAADLLGLPMPPTVDYETADLSPMARSFYAESKSVHNDRIKSDLGVVLKYPTYREGLAALLQSE